MGQQLLRTFGKILPIQREVTRRVVRSNSRLPSAVSSFSMRRLRADCDNVDGFGRQPKTAIFHQGAKGVEIVEVKIYGHGGILIGSLAPSPRPARGDGG